MRIIIIVTLIHFGVLFLGFNNNVPKLVETKISRKIFVKTRKSTQTIEGKTTKTDLEKPIQEKKVEKKVEKKIEKKIEKKTEKKAEKKIEKETTEEISEIVKESSSEGENTNSLEENLPLNISSSGSGSYIASSSDGLYYEILREVEPEYPEKANRLGIKGIKIVEVKFLVGQKGEIKTIEILSERDKFGFSQEVEKSLKKWRFKPIFYKNKPIEVYFYKKFKFER